MDAWTRKGGKEGLEQKVVTISNTSYVYRRAVRITKFVRRNHFTEEAPFVFASEVEIRGLDTTPRVIEHEYEINPQSNVVDEYKLVSDAGNWHICDAYPITAPPP